MILQPTNENIEKLAAVIKSGGIASFPTETVYGLGADAFNSAAVEAIFAAKGRPADNPLIVHISDVSQIQSVSDDFSALAQKLASAFWPGPMSLVIKSNGKLPGVVTAGLDTVAVRLPANEYAFRLIEESGTLIAAPSANISGSPSPTKAEHVYADFGEKFDILDGGDTTFGLESTVIDTTGQVPVILRPGFITPEMVENAVGNVKIHESVLANSEITNAGSPGMKYRHYSPKANVTVVAGNEFIIANRINIMYDRSVSLGSVPIIVCLTADVSEFGVRRCEILGDDAASAAKNLFSTLRNADENGFTEIFFKWCDTSGVGLALMNRILRAAGFTVIK